MLLTREEARKNDGYCEKCAQIKSSTNKVKRDLISTFGGSGKRGFVQLLKKSKFLQGIKDERDIALHNDRIDIIEMMIGYKGFDRLYEILADSIIKIAQETSEGE